jgi:hypothetical protein
MEAIMRSVERSFEPIIVRLSGKGHLELRIREDESGKDDRYMKISAKEARLLAYRLLSQAEKTEW